VSDRESARPVGAASVTWEGGLLGRIVPSDPPAVPVSLEHRGHAPAAPRSLAIRILEQLPAVTAVLVIVSSAAVLVAWAMRSQAALGWGHDSLVVMPITALTLLVAGCALWLGRDAGVSRASRIVAHILGVFVAAAGALFLYETAVDRDVGIDLLLFRQHVLVHGGIGPGRPAPNAAACFLLLGLALATLDVETRREQRPATWGATLALVVAFTALVGYINGAVHLYELQSAAGMAVPTAVACAALGVGIVFARRRPGGLGAILLDDGAGGVLARRLMPAALVVPMALGWVWFWGQRLGIWTSTTDSRSLFEAGSSVCLVWLVARCAHVVHAADDQRAQLFLREQAARVEAESANRTKGDFLAVMSHELRTPLTAIIGYQELLADGITGPVNEAQQQQLGRIKVSARHLLQLIDEILTYSRAEAGKEEVRAQTVQVDGIVDEAAALIEPIAADKGVAFSARRLGAALPIRTDPHKARQILVNLLSNAVKFTDRGGRVSLEVRQVAERVEFAIADTGIGIPGQFLDRIFDPFWQVEQMTTRRAGGTGLGLSVSRRLAALLGGEIRVDSEPGRGSVFTVVLPRVLPQPGTLPTARDVQVRRSSVGRADSDRTARRSEGDSPDAGSTERARRAGATIA